MLARVLAHSGQADVALEMIQDEIQRLRRNWAQAVRVGLLEALDVLEEAESAAVTLLQKVPRQMGLYRQVAQDSRAQGRAGGSGRSVGVGVGYLLRIPRQLRNVALDVQAVRSLARLYLEDRVADERVEDLLAKLGKHVQEPSWEDGYLAATGRPQQQRSPSTGNGTQIDGRFDRGRSPSTVALKSLRHVSHRACAMCARYRMGRAHASMWAA